MDHDGAQYNVVSLAVSTLGLITFSHKFPIPKNITDASGPPGAEWSISPHGDICTGGLKSILQCYELLLEMSQCQ